MPCRKVCFMIYSLMRQRYAHYFLQIMDKKEEKDGLLRYFFLSLLLHIPNRANTMMKQKDGFCGERSIVLPPLAIDIEKNDPLVSSLYITDIGYYPKAAHHARIRRQPIDEYVLIYCVNGAGSYAVGSESYVVGENQYFILPAGVPHSYAADEATPWTIYWIHFNGPHAAIYAGSDRGPRRVNPGLTSRISDRNSIFEEIFTTLLDGLDREHLRYASSLFHHYLASMRYLTLYRQSGQETPLSHQSDILEAAIRFMQENIEKRLTIESLVAYTGYSSRRLSALFHQQTGHTPTGYFNLLKVQRACQLMDTTDMRINQLCHKVGIDDCYYFSRLFSKVMGMSPKAYRERQNLNTNTPAVGISAEPTSTRAPRGKSKE